MIISEQRNVLACFVCALFCATVHAQNSNIIGATLLQAINPGLNGAGIRVEQVEAAIDTNGDWQVNPTNPIQPVTLFTYFSNGLYSTTFPNTLGGASGHADNVAEIFYGINTGVATNIAHVDNVEADYYYSDIIAAGRTLPLNTTDPIVNQSYSFGSVVATNQEILDSQYDNYSMQYHTLFISGANNGGPVSPPATCYNGIGVAAYGGSSSYGPTIDNGRCKPDITAPAGETSWSTPQVAGSAAILMQAGLGGYGGSDTNSAANIMTIKALLLDGTVKPGGWHNVPPEPLDNNYGAGMLNVYNSYEQLVGGKHNCNFSTNIPMGTAHPPVVTTVAIPVLNGWDFETNSSSASDDSVNHYFFNVTNASGSTFALTTTLVWERHQWQTNINNLALYLYNTVNSNLVASSTSEVDNVQYLFVPQLPQGRYDLEVWKAGGGAIVSDSEPYALAWGISSQSLGITRSGTNVVLSWPAYPAGFATAATDSLTSAAWSTNNMPPPVITNDQNVIALILATSAQFFRLQTPDF